MSESFQLNYIIIDQNVKMVEILQHINNSKLISRLKIKGNTKKQPEKVLK